MLCRKCTICNEMLLRETKGVCVYECVCVWGGPGVCRQLRASPRAGQGGDRSCSRGEVWVPPLRPPCHGLGYLLTVPSSLGPEAALGSAGPVSAWTPEPLLSDVHEPLTPGPHLVLGVSSSGCPGGFEQRPHSPSKQEALLLRSR